MIFLASPTTLCCRCVVWVGCDLFRPVSCVCCVRLRRQPACWDGKTTVRLTVAPSESRAWLVDDPAGKPLMCPGQLSWGISHVLAFLALYSSGSWLGLCSVSQRSRSSVGTESALVHWTTEEHSSRTCVPCLAPVPSRAKRVSRCTEVWPWAIALQRKGRF